MRCVMAMSDEEIRALPAVVPLAVAGRALGMGRDKTMQLYRSGEFPCKVLPLGRKLKVRRFELLSVLGLDEPDQPAAPTEPVADARVPTAGYVLLAVPVTAEQIPDLLQNLGSLVAGHAPT